ncbi:hypothetical protein BH11MYX1_BH11MYX1_27730 [soil metagenome]
MYRLILVAMLMFGCVAEDDNEPSADDMAAADAWAQTSDGKADLPTSYGCLVAWLKNFYTNQLSAVWGKQEHPASSAAAIARIKQMLAAGGIDPSRALFKTSVQRLRFSTVADHSEINIVLPTKQVIRLIGDPKGPGAYVDSKKFEESLAPALCLSWSELHTAVETSYASGAYGLDFVCHNMTEKVLRSLGIGTAKFSAQIHAYSLARYVWGPALPSFNSSNPAAWHESRACN